jgi:hypothetical protein
LFVHAKDLFVGAKAGPVRPQRVSRLRWRWLRRRHGGAAARGYTAFHHVPVLILILVLFVALGPFLAADGQHSIGEGYIEILLIDAWQLRRHVNRVLALGKVDLTACPS